MDADALFNRDWDTIMVHMVPRTEVVLACLPVAPLWERVLARFVYCKATPKAEHLLAQTAQFILQNMVEKNSIWFADQIALFVNSGQFVEDDQALSRVDSSLLIDMRHMTEALVWGVTTFKNGESRYKAVRRSLCEKHGQLTQISLDYVFRYISQQRKDPIFAVRHDVLFSLPHEFHGI